MWTNSLLKKNAWQALKSYYWVALGVTAIAAFLGANAGFNFSFSSSTSTVSDMEYMDSEELIALLIVFLMMSVFAWLIGCAWTTFLGGPVRVGQCKFFCSARNGDVNFSHLFDNFKSGRYMPTVKTMFFMNLYIFLWSLLFYIPGIIRTYEWFLVPYLLSENPNLSRERAFEISKKTMDGEKMNLFLLQFSFIGWYLLGMLACCIGLYFVMPYQQATMAEFYMCMRAKMLSYGFTTEDELSDSNDSFDGFGGFGGGGNPYDNDTDYSNSYGSANNNNYNDFGGYSAPNTDTSNPYDTNMPGITNDAYGNPIDHDNPYDN